MLQKDEQSRENVLPAKDINRAQLEKTDAGGEDIHAATIQPNPLKKFILSPDAVLQQHE